MNEIEKLHRFEAAGLGKAPFRFTGVSENLFFIPGVPEATKPGGSCDYCGAGIRYEFHIISADGKEHKVGCDCIRKVGDAGLQKQIDPKLRAMKRAKAQDKATLVYETLSALVESLRTVLVTEPHPSGYTDRETGKPMTKLDWAQWMTANCGAAGRAGVLKRLQREYPLNRDGQRFSPSPQ